MQRLPIIPSLVCALLLLSVGQAGPAETNVYSYRMKGKVRLLFFWVGKDDVGGGTISVTRTTAEATGVWAEEVEVLFGSNPDRVPGNINRWGYGREKSLWSRDPLLAEANDLRSTVFEGFMKHSKEESLSEVQKNNGQQNEVPEFLYDGIRSVAGPDRVAAEVRTFATASDFRYEDSAPVHCGYQERLKLGGPDRVRALKPVPPTFQHPYGFLTGTQRLIREVLSATDGPTPLGKSKGSLNYAYNGQEYRLELRDTELLKRFELPLAEGQVTPGKDNIPFDNVVKAEFRLTKLAKNETHEFTLWFPSKGKFRGIPLRIVDKPRWWLRIELNLEPDTQKAPPRSQINCDAAAASDSGESSR